LFDELGFAGGSLGACTRRCTRTGRGSELLNCKNMLRDSGTKPPTAVTTSPAAMPAAAACELQLTRVTIRA
jgi:hypothetical protein